MLKNELNGNNENDNPETNMGTENNNNSANDKSSVDNFLSAIKKFTKVIKEDIGVKSPIKIVLVLIIMGLGYFGWEYKIWEKISLFSKNIAQEELKKEREELEQEKQKLRDTKIITDILTPVVNVTKDSITKKEEQKSVEVAKFNALEKALVEEMRKTDKNFTEINRLKKQKAALKSKITKLENELKPYKNTVSAYNEIIDTWAKPTVIDSIRRIDNKNFAFGFKAKFEEAANKIEGAKAEIAYKNIENNQQKTELAATKEKCKECEENFEVYKKQAEADKKQLLANAPTSSSPTNDNKLQDKYDSLDRVFTSLKTENQTLLSFKKDFDKNNPYNVKGLFAITVVVDDAKLGSEIRDFSGISNSTPIPIQKIPKIKIVFNKDRINSKLDKLDIEDRSGEITIRLRYYLTGNNLAPTALLQGNYFKSQKINNLGDDDIVFFNNQDIKNELVSHLQNAQSIKKFHFEIIYKPIGCNEGIRLEKTPTFELKDSNKGVSNGK